MTDFLDLINITIRRKLHQVFIIKFIIQYGLFKRFFRK